MNPVRQIQQTITQTITQTTIIKIKKEGASEADGRRGLAQRKP
jgi:hypothetical protein